ncbi:MAG: serine hydrolase [bacterium]
MQRRIFLIYLFALSVCLAPILTAQSNVNIQKIDSIIAKAVVDFKLTGMSVGIIKNDSVVFEKGYGEKIYGKDEPVTSKTLFGIASLSKAFTAACIGILIDEGKLNWDDRVIDVLPGFQLYDRYVTREMRIKDLLTHRSGYDTFDGDLLWYGTNYDRKEVIRRFKFAKPKYSFRSEYGYSNIMFDIAGEVIEQISGKTWNEFVKERIFKPLEMTASTTSIKDFTTSTDLALPHLENVPMELINYDNCGPAAAINSSADELLTWLNMWLNKGELNGKRILSEETVNNILSSQTVINIGSVNNPGGRHFVNAGMGWFLADYGGRLVVSHTGGLPGYLSRVTIIPEEKLGIVVLTNDDNMLFNIVSSMIVDMYLGRELKDYFAIEKERLIKEKERNEKEKHERLASKIPGTKTTLDLKEYAGLYSDVSYGNAEVTYADGELILKLIPTERLFTSKMEHWHYHTFNIKFADPYLPEGFVTFTIDNKGKVSGFTIDLPNPDFHFYDLKFERVK